MVNHLFPENRKSIPEFLCGKRLLKNVTLQILGRSFFVCCLAHQGSTVGFLLLQCSSGVAQHPRDLQVSVATRFCWVLIFASLNFIPVRPPLTRPTLFFYADLAIFIAFQKKNKKIFIPTNPKMFQKIGTKSFKNVKLMLKIIFCISLDVLNYIICMFSGTVDDI